MPHRRARSSASRDRIAQQRRQIERLGLERAVQMEQVLVNLMRNAIEAVGEDGEVRVVVGRDGGRPSLAVLDSGHGIAPGVADRLFTPFFSTRKDGRGIGLTLVQEVLARHGFDFVLRNRGGGGAEFRMWM